MSVIAIGLLLFLQQVYAPSDFSQVTGGSLSARFDSAMAQGRRGTDDTFWIAWRFPVRPGVRINTWENNVTISSTTSSDGIEWLPNNAGEQRVAIFLLAGESDGIVQKTRLINLSENFRVHDRKVYWLGEPAADESLTVLSNLMSGSPKRSAAFVQYMTLHDSPAVADRLLQIAHSENTSIELRKSAILGLGRLGPEAGRKAGDELEKIVMDPNIEIERQAVLAISRLQDDEAIPALIRIAKDHSNIAIRKQAIQSLGQKKDPRVAAFFEQMLKKN